MTVNIVKRIFPLKSSKFCPRRWLDIIDWVPRNVQHIVTKNFENKKMGQKDIPRRKFEAIVWRECRKRLCRLLRPREWVVGASSESEPAGYADSSTRAGKLHKRHQYQCVPVTNNCNHCRHENKFADNLTTHKKFLACVACVA